MRGIAARLGARLALLVLASLVIFLCLNALPGDPALLMLGMDARPDTIAALHRQLGLDAPLAARYGRWIAGLFTGNLGMSYAYETPVGALLAERAQASLPLCGIALALAPAIGLPAGILAAFWRRRAAGTLVMAALQLAKSIPDFGLALLLTGFFAGVLRWVPAEGFPGWGEGLLPGLRALALPAIGLALPQAAVIARFMRSSTITTLREPFILTARSHGLSQGAILRRHVIPNAILPVLALLSLQVPLLLTGTVVIENVFNIPGIGRLLLEGVNQRDVPVVQSVAFLVAAAAIGASALLDLARARLNPAARRS